MAEQEGLPGDVTLQMMKMNTAPLPSTYLHITISRTQLRNEPNSISQFDLWISGVEKLTGYQYANYCVKSLLPTIVPVLSSSFEAAGENALLFIWHIGWIGQYSPALLNILYKFSFFLERSNPTMETQPYTWKSLWLVLNTSVHID